MDDSLQHRYSPKRQERPTMDEGGGLRGDDADRREGRENAAAAHAEATDNRDAAHLPKGQRREPIHAAPTATDYQQRDQCQTAQRTDRVAEAGGAKPEAGAGDGAGCREGRESDASAHDGNTGDRDEANLPEGQRGEQEYAAPTTINYKKWGQCQTDQRVDSFAETGAAAPETGATGYVRNSARSKEDHKIHLIELHDGRIHDATACQARSDHAGASSVPGIAEDPGGGVQRRSMEVDRERVGDLAPPSAATTAAASRVAWHTGFGPGGNAGSPGA